MKTKLSDLEIDKDDLRRVSTVLAPHYGCTPEEKAIEIEETIISSRAEISVETNGFIAVAVNNKVRVFIGNHLWRWIKIENH